MAKVVIDANVIISAAFGGNPLRAGKQWRGQASTFNTQFLFYRAKYPLYPFMILHVFL